MGYFFIVANLYLYFQKNEGSLLVRVGRQLKRNYNDDKGRGPLAHACQLSSEAINSSPTLQSKRAASTLTEEPLTSEQINLARIKSDPRPSFSFYLDPEIEQDLKSNKYKPRQHPGLRRIPPVMLPEEINKAIAEILRGIIY